MNVREITLAYGKTVATVDGRRMQTPEDVAGILHAFIGNEVQEVFCVLLLNTRANVIGCVEVSRGTLSASLVHPREVFKPAILGNAANVIVGHNHPSGDPSPSGEDREVTSRLARAGKLLGIRLIDHVVVGAESAYFSFEENGLMGGA